MVGIYGAFGSPRTDSIALENPLCWHGEEDVSTYTDNHLTITTVSHPSDEESQPILADDGTVAIWLWGSIWGFEKPDGEYVPSDDPPAAYCAALYEEYGTEFVSGLNGNFVGLLYDKLEAELTFFTDRLGTRPLHYAEVNGGAVFSTDMQTLGAHQAVDLEFDLEYLAEYFSLKRTFGVKTPLRGVELLQPGSLTTVSLNEGDRTVDRYWRPVYEPTDRSHSYYATRLAELIEQAALERTDQGTDYGLLLSGGSDSRLTLAALERADCSVRTYHINDWKNTEADLARRAAQAVDAPFTFLRRDEEYQARSLASTPSVSTFGGYFNQIHAAGFEETFTAEVDELVTGHYGDMLFKANHLQKPAVDLGPVGSFELPIETEVSTLEEFIDYRASDAPSYLTDALDRSIRDIYADNVTRRGDRIVDHGVEYESLREAVLCSRCPLTNGTSHFFYYGTLQMMPSGTLFLDNRLIDLFLTIPIKSLLRGNLINRAIDRLSPDLAAIPHGDTGVGLKHPFQLHWLGSLATSFKRSHLPSSTPGSYTTQGPWPNHADLIRSHSFIRETIDENESLIRELPFLDWESVNECYNAHLAGANNLADLYTLVTFLNTPIAQQAVSRRTATSVSN
ncbi:asparagine synthase [Natronococcus sp. JC468]|uniref:asparagine synthase-related protein n=1 Tax=Natronococcus sp. JC468 TaxID=1961921 RepID=UPI001439B1C8|nr:asparagine synthase-related protein [Natronococcus sp. JC468]NKE36574.1 asparagine synthase [Natronococcus sp. JC468]